MSDHIPVPCEREWTPEEKEAFFLRQDLPSIVAEAARLREALEGVCGEVHGHETDCFRCEFCGVAVDEYADPAKQGHPPDCEWFVGHTVLSSTPTTSAWIAEHDQKVRADFMRTVFNLVAGCDLPRREDIAPEHLKEWEETNATILRALRIRAKGK